MFERQNRPGSMATLVDDLATKAGKIPAPDGEWENMGQFQQAMFDERVMSTKLVKSDSKSKKPCNMLIQKSDCLRRVAAALGAGNHAHR